MSLEHTVQTYRDRCQLFVWEVYEELALRHKHLLHLLEHLGASGKPLTAEECAAAKLIVSRGTAKTARDQIGRYLRRLYRNDLVRRASGPPPATGGTGPLAYRLSDLGEQVLVCAQRGGIHVCRPSA